MALSDAFNQNMTGPYSAFHHPLTPPSSSSLQSRRPLALNTRVALPPIAHLDRHLSALPPLTPPDDGDLSQASSSTRLPPILPSYDADPFVSKHSHYRSPEPEYQLPEPPSQPEQLPQEPPAPSQQPICVWDSSPGMIDWLDFTRNRSAHFIAEKTCEMICYLWFATSPVARRSRRDGMGGTLSNGSSLVAGGTSALVNGDAGNAYPSPNQSPSSPSHSTTRPLASSSTPSTSHSSSSSPSRSPPSTLQLVATPSFVNFMQKLLETTQVSQSVIVLSLHYIHRLKERNRFTTAQRGSEFRIAVAALMMANKFLDDNTYTNKTWSEVSGIDLAEINRMEREFLLGVDFNLYVDKPTYESWLNLLKGLVIAKERDSLSRSRTESRRHARDARKVAASRTTKVGDHHHHHQPHRQIPVSSIQTPYPQASFQTSHSHPHSQATATPSYTNSHTQREPSDSRSSGSVFGSNQIHYATPTRLPPLSRAVPMDYYPRARSTSPTPARYYDASATRTAAVNRGTVTSSATEVDASMNGYSNHHVYASSQPQLGSSSSQPVLPASQPQPVAPVSTTNLRLTPPQLRINTTAATNGSASNKRTAEDAFSPRSASYARLPNKRPVSMVLQIPDSTYGTTASTGGVHSSSPLESLSHFASKMTIAGVDSPEKKGHQHQQTQPQQHQQSQQQMPLVSSTLVAPYSYQVDHSKRGSQPQELYFYTLASSPMERYSSRRDRMSQPREEGGDVDVDMSIGRDAEVDGSQDVEDVICDDSEREDTEAEIHGQRLRTRKGKLMRWYRGAEAQPSTYAYDYSKTHSAYRQYQAPAHSTSVAGSYNPSTTTSSTQQMPSQQIPSTHTVSSTVPAGANAPLPIIHPVPRPFIGVVQSASTSPSGIYIRDVGYPSSAYPAPVQTSGRPSNENEGGNGPSWYSSSSSSTMPSYHSTHAASASYHPSPVQSSAKVEYPHRVYPSAVPQQLRTPLQTTAGSSSSQSSIPPAPNATSLPHFHDNVWARPPAVIASSMARRQEEDDWSEEGSSEEGMDSEPASSSNRYYTSTSTKPTTVATTHGGHDMVPTAPFANAGPAGVHVPFGEYGTSAYPPYHSAPYSNLGGYGYGYSYSPEYGYGSSSATHHQQQQAVPLANGYSSHSHYQTSAQRY